MAIHDSDVDEFYSNGAHYPAADQEQRERDAIAAAKWESLTIDAPSDWYTTTPPKRVWLLRDPRRDGSPGVLPLGKVGQLIGAGGSSKTMASIQCAVSVSTGSRWLGTFDISTQGRSLLLLGEEDREECRRRLYHAAASARVVPAPGSIVVLPLAGVPAAMVESDRHGNFKDTAFATWLRQYVAREQFRLVVIDPLSRFGGRDSETENAAATRFIQALEAVSQAGGASTLNVHHSNQSSRGGGGKVNATSGRGVTGLVDGARWQCALEVDALDIDGEEESERLDEVVTFSVTKSNYARKPKPVVLRHDYEHGGALVPVDGADAETIAAARGNDRAADVRRSAKAERAAKVDAERCAREDAALASILAAPNPPASKREIRAALAAALGACSHDRADAALARWRTASC